MKILVLLLITLQSHFTDGGRNFFRQDFERELPRYSANLQKTVKSDTTRQCKGIAKSTGEQCKIKTSNDNGFCYLHQEQAGEKAIPEAESSAKQCLGYAKSTGQQCRNKTTNTNGYCYIHKDQAPGYKKTEPETDYTGQCNATTKAGSRCERTAQSGSRYCWQHQK